MAETGTPEQLSLDPTQPWLSAKSGNELKEEDRREKRNALLADLANSRLASIEQRTAYVLRAFPETRDSDTALLIRYWTRFQAEVLEGWSRVGPEVMFDLEISDSITRARRHVQNDLALFQATRWTQERRGELQIEFNEYLAARKEGDPEIRFYVDETGGDPGDRYTGVAGICVLEWREFEMQHAALTSWREKQPWLETLHFNKLTDDSKLGPFVALLAQLKRRRSGLLFVGHAVPSRGGKREAMLCIITQLIVDSLQRARDLGCLNVLRAVTVIKEAEEGFDQLFLGELQRTLGEQLAREFPGRAYLKSVTPLPKGREVLLEAADTIASGMRRRALSGGSHSKDRLAEMVMNVTGFEDPGDNGAMFKAFKT